MEIRPRVASLRVKARTLRYTNPRSGRGTAGRRAGPKWVKTVKMDNYAATLLLCTPETMGLPHRLITS